MFGSSPIEQLAKNAMMAGAVFCDMSALSFRFLPNSNQLLASASAEIQLQVGTSSDFVAQIANMTCKKSGTIADPDFLVNLVSGGSDRQLLNQPTHALNVFGNYGGTRVPGSMGYPKLLEMNSLLTITLTNLIATNWDYIYGTFLGFRVYYLKNTTRNDVFHVL